MGSKLAADRGQAKIGTRLWAMVAAWRDELLGLRSYLRLKPILNPILNLIHHSKLNVN